MVKAEFDKKVIMLKLMNEKQLSVLIVVLVKTISRKVNKV